MAFVVTVRTDGVWGVVARHALMTDSHPCHSGHPASGTKPGVYRGKNGGVGYRSAQGAYVAVTEDGTIKYAGGREVMLNDPVFRRVLHVAVWGQEEHKNAEHLLEVRIGMPRNWGIAMHDILERIGSSRFPHPRHRGDAISGHEPGLYYGDGELGYRSAAGGVLVVSLAGGVWFRGSRQALGNNPVFSAVMRAVIPQEATYVANP